MVPDVQTVWGGVFLGALYGTAAVGFQVILGAGGRVHLAYGHLWVGWALAFSSLLAVEVAPAGLLLPGMVAAAALAGWVLHPAALWRGKLTQERARSFFLLTLGAAFLVEDVGGRLWPLPGTALPWAPAPLLWQGISLPPAKLALVGAGIGLAVGVHVYLKKGRWGRALAAWNRGTAPIWLVGVDAGRLGQRAAALGFAVCALAGGFLALSYAVSIREGMVMTVRALVLAVLGGTLSPLGVLGLGVGLGVGEAWIGQAAGLRWGPGLGYALLLGLPPVLARRRKP